jgi:Sulfotransferase domain
MTETDSLLNQITIVSGLPRSGTSMMMKMLEAGGIPPLTDRLRTPDEDNPKGYYEFERVKKLSEGDTSWLPEARGKAVKVIAALLQHLPPEFDYAVILMRRNMNEILASQREMLIRRGENPDAMDDQVIAGLFEKHLQQIESWAASQKNIKMIEVNYNDLFLDPNPDIDRIDQFLGGWLDREKMSQVIDPDLYRQRG